MSGKIETVSEKIIGYFAKRHVLTNMMMISVLVGGVLAWVSTNKEEMPSVTFERVRISVSYPGAPASDVEYFVAKPIEEAVRGLDGVYRVTSSCGEGRASVNVELEPGLADIDAAVTEIRNAVLDVKMPEDVVDDPEVRVFKTDRKAILDIAIYDSEVQILDPESRKRLQKYAFALESRLLALPEINSVTNNGYLKEEIQIKVDPRKLAKYEVPFNTLMREIRANNVRQPAGSIEAHGEPKVTLLSELDSKKELEDLIIQGGFDGRVIRLGEAAEIVETHEKNKSIQKVNGHEAVMFSAVKNASTGILEGIDVATRAVLDFRKNNLQGTSIRVVMLDDESIDVRNRLSLITNNGLLGFVMILAMLFAFLNIRAGIWVAMGIPFTLCFTMICASMMGYTINGTTLAAVIIVMGIVVDDAIVVAETITRRMREGIPANIAVVKGAAFVMMPVIASITTTCVAFVPLLFFEGHFGRFTAFIPPIICLMLGASLLESMVILPGHLGLGVKPRAGNGGAPVKQVHWFDRFEDLYGLFLERLLPYRWAGFVLLTGFVVGSYFVASRKFKFVMFPNTETRDLVLSGMTPPGSDRYDTARMARQIEDLVIPYIGKEVVGMRTSIAQSRRGGAVQENQFRMNIEIVSKEKRKKSADQLVAEFEKGISGLKGFSKVKFAKSRWGNQSGSPIELFVQQNDDTLRQQIVKELAARMEAHPAIKNVEVDEGMFAKEYRIKINREKVKRLSINASDIASTFRAALEGVVLYEFSNGDEEVRVRLTTIDSAKTDIERVLDIPVENNRNYLVPLRDVVSIEQVVSPTAISRRDMKRSITIDADIETAAKKTPLEIADDLEANVFPEFLSKYPTTTLAFGGEIQDTRESASDFRNASLLALLLIYGILAVLFDSTLKPLFIMLAIPLGVAGVIFAFYFHGRTLFGFYAGVGTLGLAGVVINDAIIMLVQLDEDYDKDSPAAEANRRIARIAQTRLRAVVLTTLTTVAGVMPTAYGLAGYDAMLAEMMLALAWGMIFGTISTLVLVPALYAFGQDLRRRFFARPPVGDMKTEIPKIVALGAVLLGLVSSPVSAQPLAPTPLTFGDFVAKAAANGREFEEILVRGAALRYRKGLRLPPRHWVLSVREDLDIFLNRDEDDLSTSVGLSKLFPMTGTEVTADYGFNPTAKSANSSSDFSLTVAQPIAENAFGRSTRLLDKIVGIETDVARHQIVEAYEDYMAALMTAYIDWYEAFRNLEIGRSSYAENEKLLENINSRQRSRIAKAIDVNKIKLQVIAKKEKLVELEEKYENRLNQIKRAIRYEGPGPLIPAAPESPLVSTGTLAGSFARFEESGRTMLMLRLLEEKSSVELNREADDLLPSLRVLLTASREGERTDFKLRDDRLTAGLALEWPFFDERQGAEHKTAEVERERTRLSTLNARERLRTEIRNLALVIARETRLVGLADEKIALSESILTDESENYTYARASLNDYIGAVNGLDANHFNRILHEALLRKASVEWLRLTDRLVEDQVLRTADPAE